MRKIFLLLALSTAASFAAGGAAAVAVVDYKSVSESVLPTKVEFYNRDQLLAAFTPVVETETVLPYLTQFLDTIFNETFPKPKHSVSIITEGWRCLYRKMLIANTETESGERIENQMLAIHQLMYLHKTHLETFAPDFAKTLPKDMFACGACVGISKDAK